MKQNGYLENKKNMQKHFDIKKEKTQNSENPKNK